MHEWLAGHARWLGQAHFQGQLHLVEDYPGAIDSSDPSDRVLGDVYELPAFEVDIAHLDAYEECAPDQPQPHLYLRVIRTVVMTHSDEATQAWIYLYNRSVLNLPRIRSGDFLSGV